MSYTFELGAEIFMIIGRHPSVIFIVKKFGRMFYLYILGVISCKLYHNQAKIGVPMISLISHKKT